MRRVLPPSTHMQAPQPGEALDAAPGTPLQLVGEATPEAAASTSSDCSTGTPRPIYQASPLAAQALRSPCGHLRPAPACSDACGALQAALASCLPPLLQHAPGAVQIKALPLLQAALQAAAAPEPTSSSSAQAEDVQAALLAAMLALGDGDGGDGVQGGTV